MVNHAPLCLNQEEAIGAGQEKALAIRYEPEGFASNPEYVHPRGRPEAGRRQVRRGSARSVASREDRPLMSHHAGVTGVYTDLETAYKTLCCALIHQAYLDATNKRKYLRPNRENDRAENERSAIYFFRSRAFRILCDILNLTPEQIAKKANDTK